MPRDRLLPNLEAEYDQTIPQVGELIMKLQELATLADGTGGAPAGYNFTRAAVQADIARHVPEDKGYAWMTDKRLSTTLRLTEVLRDAVNKNYNINNPVIFNKIYWVVASYISLDSVPMRVLGNTAEAMVKTNK